MIDLKPRDKLLLQHYLDVTSVRLFAFHHSQNPFCHQLLPMASEETAVLHGLLAVSGSHLSFQEDSVSVEARSHYAICLRAAKYEITRVIGGSKDRALPLLALLILMCYFESVNGDMKGALLTHLRAATAILPLVLSLRKAVTERLSLVLLESYLFFAFVSGNVGLSPTNMIGPDSAVQALSLSIGRRAQYLNLQGFMFGRIFPLFEIIPEITKFAHRLAKTAPRHQDPGICNDFAILEARILEWEAGDVHVEAQNAASSDEVCDGSNAGLLFQYATLIFLRAALCGPYIPPLFIMVQIEILVDEFVRLSKRLARAAKTRTLMLWPTLIVGSCARMEQHRAHLEDVLYQSHAKMHATTSVAKLLRLLWSEREYGTSVFGPYGIGMVAQKYNISLSLG